MTAAFLPLRPARLSLSFWAISAKLWGKREEFKMTIRKASAKGLFADILNLC
jgi:hypothetical protein